MKNFHLKNNYFNITRRLQTEGKNSKGRKKTKSKSSGLESEVLVLFGTCKNFEEKKMDN